jgi:hypothetical protein
VSSHWLVPLCAGFGLGGGGGAERGGTFCPTGLAGDGGAFFCANFSFLAFCTQSGQVSSLAFAD